MIIVDNEDEEPLLIISNVLKTKIEAHPELLKMYKDYEWSAIGTAWELIKKKENQLLTGTG